MVARFGGEEFFVLLPNTDLDSAADLMDRVLSDIRGTTIKMAYSDTTITMTASAGIGATIPKKFSDYQRYLNKVDQALYKAKGLGRDRYHLVN